MMSWSELLPAQASAQLPHARCRAASLGHFGHSWTRTAAGTCGRASRCRIFQGLVATGTCE